MPSSQRTGAVARYLEHPPGSTRCADRVLCRLPFTDLGYAPTSDGAVYAVASAFRHASTSASIPPFDSRGEETIREFCRHRIPP
nr:hypothetical protein CFP56_46742 [Quercus suber]